jgi:hypothetical protein
MKKITLLCMLLVSLATANAKCTWGSVKIEQMGSNSHYLWLLKGDVFKDTCVKYDYNLIDLSNGKESPYLMKQGTEPYVYFRSKGKYRFNLKLTNKCTGCDTIIYSDVLTYGYFTQCQFSYQLGSTYDPKCKDSIAGQMTKSVPKTDYCWTYMMELYLGDAKLNSISDSQWVHGTDSAIWEWTSRNRNCIVYSKLDSMDAARFINYKFTKPGRYVLRSYWMNWCFNNDTIMIRRLTIDPCVTLKTEDPTTTTQEPKIIGVYDMLGRPVKHIRKEEIMILLYDDGSTKKIIQE